jgi:hypothetical protein
VCGKPFDERTKPLKAKDGQNVCNDCICSGCNGIIEGSERELLYTNSTLPLSDLTLITQMFGFIVIILRPVRFCWRKEVLSRLFV